MQRLLPIAVAVVAVAVPTALRGQTGYGTDTQGPFWGAGVAGHEPSETAQVGGVPDDVATAGYTEASVEQVAEPPPGAVSAGRRGAAGVLPRSNEGPVIPLPGPTATSHGGSAGRQDRISSAVTVVGSLALVVGLFLTVAWALRRAVPGASATLPGEVFEVLGRAPLSGRQQVHLLRCGSKLLLVSVTPGGAETLTEITDAAEADRLAGLCQQSRPGSATATFRQVLGQLTSRGAETEIGEL